MKKQLLLILVLFSTWQVSFAQLNESDTTKFQVRVSLTGNYQQGNVEILTIRSKIDFSYSPVKDIVFKSQNSSLYQVIAAKKADNDIFSRNYLYYKPQNRIYPFGIAYISANYRRKIDSRYFAGAGVTWRVIDKKNAELKLSSGAVYEKVNYSASIFNYSKYNGNTQLNTWRATLYSAGFLYLFTQHVRIYYDAYWQPAFNDKDDYKTELATGVDFLMWKGLSFNTVFTYSHDNVVVNKVKQDDKILTFGLAYNLKK